ncbi:MAG TPA: hypothetical protein VHS03_04260, partial [Gaiellaceae bacterium]|nr:hypothetical protein [Gaiellaceae bacterium]
MAGRAPRKLIVLVVVLAGFFLAGQISGSAATQRATTYPNAKQRGQDFYMHRPRLPDQARDRHDPNVT